MCTASKDYEEVNIGLDVILLFYMTLQYITSLRRGTNWWVWQTSRYLGFGWGAGVWTFRNPINRGTEPLTSPALDQNQPAHIGEIPHRLFFFYQLDLAVTPQTTYWYASWSWQQSWIPTVGRMLISPEMLIAAAYIGAETHFVILVITVMLLGLGICKRRRHPPKACRACQLAKLRLDNRYLRERTENRLSFQTHAMVILPINQYKRRKNLVFPVMKASQRLIGIL